MATVGAARPALHSSQSQPLPTPVCPQCGIALPHFHENAALGAQKRIEELEDQVKVLSSKATEAVDKLADYEDELRRLKSAAQQNTITSNPPIQSTSNNDTAPQRSSSEGNPSPTPTPPTRPQHSRFPSLFRRAASTPNTNAALATTSDPSSQQPPPAPPSSSSADDTTTTTTATLHTQLAHEKSLRQRAESQVSQAHAELEDLSAQLFQQANEMVAAERRGRAQLEARLAGTEARLQVAEEAAAAERAARAGLQERVAVLEKRDVEKRGRLERLERAVGRIERVRGLLRGEGEGG